jgi:N-acetylglucosaminyl-diphospho-decaprenol L-rhamnosyltransferase
LSSAPGGGSRSPRVRIVIVNYNAGAYLRRSVAAALAQSFTDFDLVVVDNASIDDSLSTLPQDPRLSVRRMGENLGFAAGNNRAAADAGGEFLATLNPDAFAEPSWLAALVDAADRHSDAAMFGSTQLMADDPSRLDGAGDAYFAFGLPWRGGYGRPAVEIPREGETFSACAAAALYRLSDFRAAGGFDERFFCYCEDVDLGFRLRLMGKRCVQVKNAVVHHVGGGLAGRASAFTHYHSARNRIWVFLKDMPGALYGLLLPGFVALNLSLLAWAMLRGHGAAVWNGMRDAVRGLGPVLAQRRAVRAARTASTCEIARALCWSPLRVLARRTDVRYPAP